MEHRSGTRARYYRDFIRSLEARKPGSEVPSYLRLRTSLSILDEDLRTGRRRSPNSWGVSVGTCASALRYFLACPTEERRKNAEGCLGVTPERAIHLMGLALKKAMEGARGYRGRGIDPQAKVTILPYIERAKAALRAWKEKTS